MLDYLCEVDNSDSYTDLAELMGHIKVTQKGQPLLNYFH